MRNAALWVRPVVCGYAPVNIEAKDVPVFGHWAMARSKTTLPAPKRSRWGLVSRG